MANVLVFALFTQGSPNLVLTLIGWVCTRTLFTGSSARGHICSSTKTLISVYIHAVSVCATALTRSNARNNGQTYEDIQPVEYVNNRGKLGLLSQIEGVERQYQGIWKRLSSSFTQTFLRILTVTVRLRIVAGRCRGTVVSRVIVTLTNTATATISGATTSSLDFSKITSGKKNELKNRTVMPCDFVKLLRALLLLQHACWKAGSLCHRGFDYVSHLSGYM